MNITPLAGALGAEITGVELLHATPAQRARIDAAFLRYLVLFFPEQTLSANELSRVGSQFGALDIYPFIEGLAHAPHVVSIIKEPDEQKNFGAGWHSDTTYCACPPKATVLYALEVPTVGGDTLFANMYAAHASLSAGMRAMLKPLRALSSTAVRSGGGRAGGNHYQSVQLKHVPAPLTATHPVVRRHPETAREALYVNRLHTERFEHMTSAESSGLLAFLYAHATRPEFTCRYRWQPKTLAVWDNRCTQHYALNDYHGQRRAMWRLSVSGDAPA